MISRKNRFSGHKSLNFVYRHGQNIRMGMLACKYVNNPKRQSWRLAVVVSRKVEDSAVGRNRIRRRIYETFRKLATDELAHVDMVVTVFDSQVKGISQDQLNKLVTQIILAVNKQ